MNQINVLGVELNNFSLKESLMLTDKYMQEGALKTILYIDAKMLMEAGDNEVYKEQLQKCDLTIIDDEGILEALPKVNTVKVEDVKEEKYTRILLKKLVYGRKRIVLLADTGENLSSLEKNLTDYRSDLEIAARISMDEMEDSVEGMVNFINDVVPDVLFSRMEMTRQVAVMEESRSMMNCRLWIGLPERDILMDKKESVFKKLVKSIFRSSFKNQVKKYNIKENKED